MNALHIFALLATLAVIIYFVVVSILEGLKTTNRFRFFHFGNDFPKRGFFSTLVTSNSGLSASLLLVLVYSAQYGFIALPVVVFFWWVAQRGGKLVLDRVGDRYQARGLALHEYLGAEYGGSAPRVIAAWMSLAAYIGIFACELLLLSEIVNVYIPSDALINARLTLTTTVVAGFLLFTITFYCAQAGFRAVVKTDIATLILMALGACAMIASLLFPPLRHKIADAYSGGMFGTGLGMIFNPDDQGVLYFALFFVFNLVFWGVWWSVAMDQWHRCAATRDVNKSLDKRFGTAGWVVLVYLGFISLAFTVAGVVTRVEQGTSVVSLAGWLQTLEGIGHSAFGQVLSTLLVSLGLAGIAAAAISTMDTYLVVACQSLHLDILRGHKHGETMEVIRVREEEQGNVSRSAFAASQLTTFGLMIPIAAVALLFSYLGEIASGIYASFTFQMALVAPVYFAVFGQGKHFSPRCVSLSMLSAGVIGLIGNWYVATALEEALTSGSASVGAWQLSLGQWYLVLFGWPTVVGILGFLFMLSGRIFRFLSMLLRRRRTRHAA